ncbi:hypothetical protein K431DRAFT_299725 [Polychaeton citri CBS 116435]|uniref:UBC core domain-containing protein n=1 Tax=Polychaeton citri CBS 116435 TaxID=1314669 RepID=A0A9P4UTE1_9PEZI|nr:hypothetical protein K431DRAFT_299725 [Polychaeton citri CBS 116435]
MPRRQFVADLQAAQAAPPPGILSVQLGEDDGQVVFDCDVNGDSVRVTALIPDLGEYPKSHKYYVFCGTNAPPQVASAIEEVGGIDRKSICEALKVISLKLCKPLSNDDDDVEMPDSQEQEADSEEEDVWDGDADVYNSDDDFTVGGTLAALAKSTSAASTSGITSTSQSFRQRIRQDLRQCRDAGFKVGRLGLLMDGLNCYVTVSIRVAKLGISDEAMQAWQLESDEYLILIIQYPNGYRTNEEFQAYDNFRLKSNLAMRVVAGKKYKPSMRAIIETFTTVKRNDRAGAARTSQETADQDKDSQDGAVRDTFISKSLSRLLEDRLVPIIRYRTRGMSWEGAEEWYHHMTGAAISNPKDHNPPGVHFKHEPHNPMLPSIVQGDHFIAYHSVSSHLSFPLLAMQFTLRHFVRCTDFCLNCHRKLGGDLEAIKPYVCDNPLCLFQYMSLGFGQSIEHEIMAQPYVVDLLISFCYCQAASGKLSEFPTGLGILVPPLIKKSPKALGPRQAADQEASPADGHPHHEVGFDLIRREMIFFEKPKEGRPVRTGDWILMRCYDAKDDYEYDLHVRVGESAFYPTISLARPIGINVATDNVGDPPNEETGAPYTTTSAPKWSPARFYLYKQELDGFEPGEKCTAICRLLDLLPSVREMQEYLSSNPSSNLGQWMERIPPAALALLRWIIASNRACIMQNEESQLNAVSSKPSSAFKQDRVYGMNGYMQFRFAMGAPDKEQRFMNEVNKTAARLGLKHPTLFAWHGSPLHNWHSIIREGLHYRTTAHGRAYGHGVYHALHASTSTGYSGRGHSFTNNTNRNVQPGTWPNSILRISSAIALNEIVNAPAEFVSSSPFYVVNQLDWIQTRYLFVQISPSDPSIKAGDEKKPEKELEQDPARRPKGLNGSDVMIPAGSARKRSLDAVAESDDEIASKEGKGVVSVVLSPLKKLKSLHGGAGKMAPPSKPEAQLDIDVDATSDVTDDDDRQILLESSERLDAKLVGRSSETIVVPNPQPLFTDYEPGTLDFTKLPLMPMPQYASPQTTKRLMTELLQLSTVQDSTPLSELGWHIPVDQIENAYQWIVELHSFHTFSPTHPLVIDMRKEKVKSIVLEVRFGKDFPYSPPYIRVMSPRFLTLQQGGGGHIVAGGAMCMELLTNTGWSAICSMESVFMQVRMAIGASVPAARLAQDWRGDEAGGSAYGTQEAAEGYLRACRAHGWEVPEGFKEVAYMGKQL